MAHLPLKDPPQPQAWASDRAPGFVLPAGGAPQSSQGAGHGSHGSWPRPHKHRGLPGPGQPGANPGVFTKDGDPSWNLRPPPLFHTQLCVLQTTKPSMSVDRGGTTVSPVPATSLADTPCAASSQDICGTHAPAPPHVRDEDAKQTHISSPVPVGAARGITHTSPTTWRGHHSDTRPGDAAATRPTGTPHGVSIGWLPHSSSQTAFGTLYLDCSGADRLLAVPRRKSGH